MKKTATFLLSLTLVVIFSMTANAQLIFSEHFDYPVGDTITAHGWTAHSGTTNIIPVVSGNLTYTGFCTPVGNKISMMNSGQDVNHTFTPPATGSFYVAFLVEVSAALTGDYFLHLKDPAQATVFAAKVYVKAGTTAGTLLFGCSKAGTSGAPTVVYSTTEVPMAQTHLIVLKYTINPGTADDAVSLFVDPATASEGTATVTATDNAATDLAGGVGALALRQGGSTAAATLTLDGIRIGATWADAIGFNGVVTAPVLTTGATTNITANSASCAGNITSDGGGAISTRGICYGTTANPDTNGTKVVVSGTTGVFSGSLSGLTGGTLYHYRAYAVNSAGITYGGDSTFTTASGAVAPIVITGTASAITTTAATVGGNVTNDGGSTVLVRGICYGLTANPDTSATSFHTILAGATGTFSSNLSGLTPATVYHARAYALNAVGINYGADITFTTLIQGTPCANIAALLAQNADNTTIYEITGEVVMTYKQAFKNEKFVQDASGALMIYDAVPATGTITTVYNIGDGITGLKGKLQKYFGQYEFIPIYDPGPASSTGHVVTPTIVTAAELIAADTLTYYANQSKLIKMTGVSFVDANGTLKFGVGKRYKMTQTTSTDSLFYTNFYDADYTATATAMVIPQGTGDVTGICILYKNNYYITARDKNDISLLTGIEEGSSNNIGIYPNPSEGLFNVTLNINTTSEINVFSALGEIVYHKVTTDPVASIDLSNQNNGIYLIQVRDTKNGHAYSVKVLKK